MRQFINGEFQDGPSPLDEAWAAMEGCDEGPQNVDGKSFGFRRKAALLGDMDGCQGLVEAYRHDDGGYVVYFLDPHDVFAASDECVYVPTAADLFLLKARLAPAFLEERRVPTYEFEVVNLNSVFGANSKDLNDLGHKGYQVVATSPRQLVLSRKWENRVWKAMQTGEQG